MREHQIVISLKPEQFQEVQKQARAAGAQSVGAYVRQNLLMFLGLEEADAARKSASGAQLADPDLRFVAGELRRLHRELKVLSSEASVSNTLLTEIGGASSGPLLAASLPLVEPQLQENFLTAGAPALADEYAENYEDSLILPATPGVTGGSSVPFMTTPTMPNYNTFGLPMSASQLPLGSPFSQHTFMPGISPLPTDLTMSTGTPAHADTTAPAHPQPAESIEASNSPGVLEITPTEIIGETQPQEKPPEDPPPPAPAPVQLEEEHIISRFAQKPAFSQQPPAETQPTARPVQAQTSTPGVAQAAPSPANTAPDPTPTAQTSNSAPPAPIDPVTNPASAAPSPTGASQNSPPANVPPKTESTQTPAPTAPSPTTQSQTTAPAALPTPTTPQSLPPAAPSPTTPAVSQTVASNNSPAVQSAGIDQSGAFAPQKDDMEVLADRAFAISPRLGAIEPEVTLQPAPTRSFADTLEELLDAGLIQQVLSTSEDDEAADETSQYIGDVQAPPEDFDAGEGVQVYVQEVEVPGPPADATVSESASESDNSNAANTSTSSSSEPARVIQHEPPPPPKPIGGEDKPDDGDPKPPPRRKKLM